MKSTAFIKRSNGSHWVGDGFPVRSIFSYNDIADQMSPFLMLDYAGPAHFEPSSQRRGVGQHPHRGFETVSIVYEGEVSHRDSAGGGGTIGPGDVQWMTAAAGIVHEEFHSEAYGRSGGPFQAIQLWVNLPAKDKMSPPGYQGITKAQIPEVALPGGAGQARVIAGSLLGQSGPARTFTPMNVWDLRLSAGAQARLPAAQGHTTALLVMKGQVQLADGQPVLPGEMAVWTREGEDAAFQAVGETTALWLSGAPLNEPIVGYGPFVMNSTDEIRQAFVDFQSGRMGRIAAH